MNRVFFCLLIVVSCAIPPQSNSPNLHSDRTYGKSSWKQFSLKEKIAQMIMVRVRGDYYNSDLDEIDYAKIFSHFFNFFSL